MASDCRDIHICYLATVEMAGVVMIGVGWKAGLQELKYLSEVTGASILLSKQNNPLGKLDDISEYLNLNSLSVEGEFNQLDAGVLKHEGMLLGHV